MTVADGGSYSLVISNTVATDLTLVSRPMVFTFNVVIVPAIFDKDLVLIDDNNFSESQDRAGFRAIFAAAGFPADAYWDVGFNHDAAEVDGQGTDIWTPDVIGQYKSIVIWTDFSPTASFEEAILSAYVQAGGNILFTSYAWEAFNSSFLSATLGIAGAVGSTSGLFVGVDDAWAATRNTSYAPRILTDLAGLSWTGNASTSSWFFMATNEDNVFAVLTGGEGSSDLDFPRGIFKNGASPLGNTLSIGQSFRRLQSDPDPTDMVRGLMFLLTTGEVPAAPADSTGKTWNISLQSGWNLVGLGAGVADTTLTGVYPGAISAFDFDDGYRQVSGLTPGKGYWVNLVNSIDTTVTGSSIANLTLSLTEGWHMISSISDALAVSSISEVPANSLISIFKFDGAYKQVSDSLRQGEGYWVNLNNAATLTLGSTVTAKSSASKGRISDLLSEFKNLSLNLTSENETRRVDLFFAEDIDTKILLRLNKTFELPPPAPDRRFEMVIAKEGTNGLSGFVTKIGDRFEKRISIIAPDGNAPIRLHWSSEGLERGMYFLKNVQSGREIDMADVQELDLQPGTEHDLELSSRGGANVVTDYRLSPNYPNPFNPTTNIIYAIADPGLVTLTVFNTLGQEVKTLVNTIQSIGNYNVVWDATDNFGTSVGAGIYFYKLKVNNFVEIRKMVLVK